MYVDDSGSLSLNGGKYYFLCGVIVQEQDLDMANGLVQQFKDTSFVAELHWQSSIPMISLIGVDTLRGSTSKLEICF